MRYRFYESEHNNSPVIVRLLNDVATCPAVNPMYQSLLLCKVPGLVRATTWRASGAVHEARRAAASVPGPANPHILARSPTET